MNFGGYVVNLGADPEPLTLGSRELYKLRCADKTPGKNSVTRWFTALVGGPDLDTASRLAKGDTIILVGTLSKTEFKPKQPKYRGHMQESDEMPFAKILQVIKSTTFFGERNNEEVPHAATIGDFPPNDDDAHGGSDGVVPPELEGL